MNKKVVIIGAGIAGLASAIRLAKAGYRVVVIEANAYAGGKLTEKWLNNYRFDCGPSLFTLPELVEELTQLSGQASVFNYKKLDTICRYFYEDGTRVNAYSNREQFGEEVATKLGEAKQNVLQHLSHSAKLYELTADIFLHQSLHKPFNFCNLKTLKALLNLGKLQLGKTMFEANNQRFSNPKTVQLFNRFATYNGSNPYQAPALLNIIPHLEHNMGAYIPVGGMHEITEHLYSLALGLGVEFKFNTRVEKISVVGNKAIGVVTQNETIDSDVVVCNSDIHYVYRHLLEPKYAPKKLLKQEKSSSGFILYWGIKKSFPQLGLHNILFSENYKEEFDHIFSLQKSYHDPTVYINITSKECVNDAPEGCENWFVMVNVPHNASQQSITYTKQLRQFIIEKINRVLKTDITSFIEVEDILDPFLIEQRTSSFGGSLYGNASNNKYAAFLRHANFSSSIANLFFCGGSTHPGGGIPLCLLSAKIMSNLVVQKHG